MHPEEQNFQNGIEKADLRELVEGKSLEQLMGIRQLYGKIVHDTLLGSQVGKNKKKIGFNSEFAAGFATSGLAATDRSSSYLVGGHATYSRPESETIKVASKLAAGQFSFYQRQNIDIDIVAGDTNLNDNKVLVYAATPDSTYAETLSFEFSLAEQPGSERYVQAQKEISTIATYQQILKLGKREGFYDKYQYKVDIYRDPKTIELLEEISKVKAKNEEIWKKLFPQLTTFLQGKISVGESFTAGLLVKLITSLGSNDELLDINLNWYDKKLKTGVGTPEENVSDEKIASPETIALATQNLLDKSSANTSFAIGTTGWANYWVQGEADYFSIGVASREKGKRDSVSTARYTVNKSQEMEKSKARRNLTRYLGVTVSLYMFSRVLAKKFPAATEFAALEKELKIFLDHYGIIETKEN